MSVSNRRGLYCLFGVGIISSFLMSTFAVIRTSVENHYIGNKLINMVLLSFNSYAISSSSVIFPALFVVWLVDAMVKKARTNGSAILGAAAFLIFVAFFLAEGWYINHIYLPGIFASESIVWNVIMLFVIAGTALVLFRGLWRPLLHNRTVPKRAGGAADA